MVPTDPQTIARTHLAPAPRFRPVRVAVFGLLIALNPRAAVAATLYSAVPAFVVAYGFHLLAPGFLN